MGRYYTPEQFTQVAHAAIEHTSTMIKDGTIATGDLASDCAVKRINAGVEASRPAGANAGDIYWATDTKKLWTYDGSEWQDCLWIEAYSASDTAIHSHAQEETTTSVTPVKITEYAFDRHHKGAVRVKCKIWISVPVETMHAWIFKNGVSLSSIGVTSETTPQAKSVDSNAWGGGDVLGVYIDCGVEGTTAHISDIEICGDLP